MKIAIIGAGTLAAYILDIISRISGLVVLCQYDDRYPEILQSNGLPVFGRVDDVEPGMPVVLGIGAPAKRRAVFKLLSERGCLFPSIIDPSCIISGSACISNGVIVGPLSSVLAGSDIQEGACLLSHVNVNQNVTVGAFALIGAGAIIGNEARIGKGAHIGLGARILLGGVVEDWTDVSQG